MQRILVVEDDPVVNKCVGDVLIHAGFQVSSAFDGVDGLEAVRSARPDQVVLDIFLPRMDGLEVLIALRRFAPSVPVILISGSQHLLSESSMSLAQQLGASDILSKPFTAHELLDRVTSFVAPSPLPPCNSPKPKRSRLKKFREHLRRFTGSLSRSFRR